MKYDKKTSYTFAFIVNERSIEGNSISWNSVGRNVGGCCNKKALKLLDLKIKF